MLNSRKVSTIVSCDWLAENLHLKHLVILNASVPLHDFELLEAIPNSRYFDLKDKFSDTKATFPNTIPSTNQFETEARNLGINKDSILVVYDDKGIYWSPRVWWLFKTFEFKNIAVLDGGLPEWKNQGFETTSVLTKINWSSGNFSARFDATKMYNFKNMLDTSILDSFQIIDARSEKRFSCAIPEPRSGLRRGRIPNSANLPYAKVLNGNCLKSKQELIAIFNTFTIEEKSLVFYCGSGITACILALAAEISGYNRIAVYDGSWTEYGTLTT